LNLAMAAGTTKTITIKGNVAAGAGVGNSLVLGIAAATDITSSVALTGAFPIGGNAKTVATQAVGGLTVDVLATPAASNPLSGSVEQHVATIQLTSNAVEGFNVNSLKITQAGTAGNADISNIKLKYGATLLGTVASLTASAATVTGSPLINIPVNSSKNIDVYVDVASGISTARNIIIEVTQAADVVAVGTNSGGAVTPVAAVAFPEQGATHVVSQGGLTVAVDAATNPSAQNYVVGTSNRNMLALKFSAGSTEGQRVTQLTLHLATGTVTDISNVALYDGTTLIAGPSGIVGENVQFGVNTINTFDATGLFDVPASSNKVILVKADVPSGSTAGQNISLTALAASVKADGLLSQMDTPAASITGLPVAGNAMTIAARGTLSASLNSASPAAQVVAKGTSNKELAVYSLTAGAGEDIIVSSIILRLYKDGGAGDDSTPTAATDVTNVSVFEGTTQLGTTVAAPAGSAAFNINLTVPAGTTKVISVKGTVPTGTTILAGFHVDLHALTAGDIISSGASSLATIVEAGTVTGAYMTVGTPSLTVASSAVPVASFKVLNTDNVIMTNLILTAGAAEAVTVNSVKISFAATNTLTGTTTASANIGNVRLMDGAVQVGDAVVTLEDNGANPDTARFTGLSLTIPANQSKILSVMVKITGGTGAYYSGTVALGDIIGAGAVSGTAVNSAAVARSGTLLTIAPFGTLTVSVDSGTPLSSNIPVGVSEVPGKAGVAFTKVKLTSSIEAVNVSSIMFTRTGTGTDSNAMLVYLYDGSTLLGAKAPDAGTVTYNFAAGQEIVVPTNGGSKVLTLKADLMGIGAGSAHADAPKFYIANVPTDITSVGASSIQPITEATTTPDAQVAANVNAMYLYKTTASIAKVASADSDPGSYMEVLRVNVKNEGLYDLALNSFDFTPQYSGTITGTTISRLYLSDLVTVVATGTATSTSGTKITMSTPTANNVVAPGETKTFVLYADTTGLTTVGNSFRADLAAMADFGWIPDGAAAEVVTLTPGMPIVGQTFTK